jgi:hypothetical protein
MRKQLKKQRPLALVPYSYGTIQSRNLRCVCLRIRNSALLSVLDTFRSQIVGKQLVQMVAPETLRPSPKEPRRMPNGLGGSCPLNPFRTFSRHLWTGAAGAEICTCEGIRHVQQS